MLRISLVAVGWLAFVAAYGSGIYYVSPTGKDTNAGSKTAPWRTIQNACAKAPVGSTILVASGTYVESVHISKSLTLKSLTTTRPIIDGTGLTVPASDAALVLIKDVDNVTLQGFEVRNFKTTNSLLVPVGILIEGKANNVVIRGNLVDHIENTGSDAANINAFGIAVYGNSLKGSISNLIIDQNEVTATKTGNSETVTLNGNLNGFQVTRNLVHDVDNIGIDCIGFEGTSPIAGQDQARNGLVSDNLVYNVTSAQNPAYAGGTSADGIYVDGGTGIIIERNTVHNADIGIEVTSEHGGKVASNVITRSNLIYASNVTGLSVGGYDATRGGTKNCSFVNNTFYENDTTNSGSGEFTIQFHTAGNILKNNILVASAQGIFFSQPDSVGTIGVTSDANLYFTSVTSNATWNWGVNSYSDLASFQKATHGDSHSIFADPKFLKPAAFNFQINSSSKAFKIGLNLGLSIEGLLDLLGNPRISGTKIDLGCFEALNRNP